MICAIRGSLRVVQIVIKKPSKEICDLKSVLSRHMTDVTITGYLLATNLSSQQSGGESDKGFPARGADSGR